MPNSYKITTLARKISLAKITSGAITALPKVAFIALGTGGADQDGNLIPPTESQTELNHEVGRYGVAPVQFPLPTVTRYEVTVGVNDLIGEGINELSLIDVEGTACAFQVTPTKIKGEGEEFTFIFEENFGG